MSLTITQIHHISPEEASQITELSAQLGYQNNSNDLMKRLVLLVKSEADCVFVAKEGSTMIAWIHGFVALRVESELFIEIAGLVVHEAHFQQGIGKLLVNAVAEWGKAMGVHQLRVRCNVIRTESHKFYKKIGFKESKQQLVFALEI